MIDFSKLSAKDLTALYNGLSSGTIKRFESHAVGIDRVTRLVSQIGADEATVLEAMRSAGIEWPPTFDVGSSQHGTDMEHAALPADTQEDGSLAGIDQQDDRGEQPPMDLVVDTAPEADAGKDQSASAGAVHEGTTPAAPEMNDADRRILALLGVLGPCKVGVMRERWKAEDATFGRLAPTQQKGIMRRCVRKLESAGLVRKEGAVFSLSPTS